MSIANIVNKFDIMNEKLEQFKNSDLETQNQIRNNNFYNNLLNNINVYEAADIVFNIIIGLERLSNDYNFITWSKYSELFDEREYCNDISLTMGQFKVIINSLINQHIVNINCLSNIQLYYLSLVLDENRYEPYSAPQFKYNHNDELFKGHRITPNDDLIYDFTDNPQTRYDYDDMFNYFSLVITKCFKYTRLNSNNQVYDINQLRDLLKVIISNNSIENKFKKFFRILHEEQINMIGI